MQTGHFFSYSWYIDEKETNVTCIRVYGLNENDENVCVRVDNFTPYVYLELPEDIDWDDNLTVLLTQKIESMMGPDHVPLFKSFEMKKRLYYAHLDKNGERKRFPYLFLAFSNKSEIRQLSWKLRNPINVTGIGKIRIKMHEQDASEILQLTCRRDIPTSGWIKYKGVRVDKEDQLTNCDYEYIVDWHNLFPYESNTVPHPLIMGFDIEVYSSDPNTMPRSDRYGDRIFQISCVFARDGCSAEEYETVLLTLGEVNPSKLGCKCKAFMYPTEDDLLIGFAALVRDRNPNIITGYNIFGFDIPYMLDRSRDPCMCYNDFAKMGFIHSREGDIRKIKWSSSAYGTQEFEFLDCEGRLFVDLLPLVKRDYKMSTYTLKSISNFFLGDTKDDLNAKGIFKCYDEGIKTDSNGKHTPRAKKYMTIVGRYCIKDTVLVVKLVDKLQTWIGLSEMAKVCRVQIFDLYTRGQQVKVYSQVYYDCMYDNFVVEKDGYVVKENEHYTGAHVFEPVPGLYENVIPLDFSSLYPSTIIAYNICWSTFVKDEDPVFDSECHVFEWEDHQGCGCPEDTSKTRPKYIMCAKRRYRFLKSPKGILPLMLEGLLAARKRTKGELKAKKALLKDATDPKERSNLQTLVTVLDKRQNAYKISANSAYGALGVQKGYLPFMPGAMCTTAQGRKNIIKVSEYVPQKFGAKLVYGDTDSNYLTFPSMDGCTPKELWEFSEHVANETSKLFPPPNKLEFEEVIYKKFFIITKKRYMYIAIDEDGNTDGKIGKKGVILARRDNSKFVRDIYSENMMKVFNRDPEDEILYDLVKTINKLCYGGFPHDDFVITKSVKGTDGLKLTNVIDEPCLDRRGVQKKDTNGELMWRRTGRIGEYKIPLWRSDEERENKLKAKKAIDEEDYYLKCLPAQVQLAERMRMRGKPVSSGTRLEYVILFDGTFESVKSKQYEKIESADYYADHKRVLQIDYLYYLKCLASCLDQVLNVVHTKSQDFVLKQLKIRMQWLKVNIELKELAKPNIILEQNINPNIVIVE